MADNPVPEGYKSVTPYLVVPGVRDLLGFLERAFGAEVTIAPMAAPDGRVMHAEVRIGDSRVMMGEPPAGFAPMPTLLYLYVADADAACARALAAGASPMMAPADQFFGDRNAGIKDPCGNLWWLATRKETLSDEERRRRAAAAGVQPA